MTVTAVHSSALDIEGATGLTFTKDVDGSASPLKGEDGVLVDGATDTDARTLSFSTPKGKVDVKIEWDGGSSTWKMTAIDVSGGITGTAGGAIGSPGSSASDKLRTIDIETFLASQVFTSAYGLDALDATVTTYSKLEIEAAEGRPLEVIDYSGMLGALSETKYELSAVSMRVRPMSPDEALGITGSFRIQVGTQGTRVASQIFRANAATGLDAGDIIGAGSPGERHTFRIGVADDQVDVTATWNASTKNWELTSDVFAEGVNAPASYPVVSTGADGALTVADLAGFLSQAVPSSGISALSVGSGPAGAPTQFYIESKDNRLISISDVEGDLAARMGMVNESPVITIHVGEEDSLATIRNKINEKYQAEFGLTEPEDWVHAAVQQDADQSWYLTITANVPGEAQRITLMGGDGADDTSMQLLRRLGLTRNVEIGTNRTGTKVYREVTAIATMSEDASFTFNTVRYLSSDNMFEKARRIPASGSSSDYSASKLVQVEEGMWFNLKHTGTTAITVRHHVKNGSIKALEEGRDAIIPGLKASLDELAYGLVHNINAYQYSGYGIGADIDMTGVAFFDPLWTKAGAARALSVNDEIESDIALIGAAMGKKDGSGRAVYGKSGGSGDGSNAGRMSLLSSAMVLKDGTLTLGGQYDALLSEIGSKAAHAELMYDTQANVIDQIQQQRQAVSGVNLDEELMDIIILNRAFGAMSRYITTVDEMLDKIINGMGLVGR